MKIGLLKHRDDFPELSYSNDGQPRLKRWIIRSAEGLSGRQRYAALYAIWRAEVRSGSKRCFARLLELIDVMSATRRHGRPSACRIRRWS